MTDRTGQRYKAEGKRENTVKERFKEGGNWKGRREISTTTQECYLKPSSFLHVVNCSFEFICTPISLKA